MFTLYVPFEKVGVVGIKLTGYSRTLKGYPYHDF